MSFFLALETQFQRREFNRQAFIQQRDKNNYKCRYVSVYMQPVYPPGLPVS